jgi:hypothetical protein
MMRRTVPSASVAFALIMLAATDAAATAQRTFVASTGADSNTTFNCSLVNPCRGFAAAIGVTAAGGEVVVLDSAGYGPVTINKSVSIIAPPGVYAGVTVSSGDGITISAPGATVALRGLSIHGLGGTNGVNYSGSSGAVVLLENCDIQGMSGAAVLVTNNTVFSSLKIIVKHSIIRDNSSGLKLVGDSCSLSDFCFITLVLDDSLVIHNTAGVDYSMRDPGGQSVCSRQNNTFAFNSLDVSPVGPLQTCSAL